VYKQWTIRKLKYKGTYYSIGDSIEIRHDCRSPDDYKTHVGIIIKIYVFDEPDSMPQFEIYWYWREAELKKELARHPPSKLLQIKHESRSPQQREYVNYHLFWDIDYGSGRPAIISIASVLHKVLICGSFADFLEYKDCKFREFGNVFYSQYSYTLQQYTKYKESPFARLPNHKLKQTIYTIYKKLEQADKKKKQNEEMKRREKSSNCKQSSMDKVRDYLRVYNAIYLDDDDECKCMDQDIPFNRADFDEEALKIPSQRGRRLVLDEISAMDQTATYPPNTENTNNLRSNTNHSNSGSNHNKNAHRRVVKHEDLNMNDEPFSFRTREHNKSVRKKPVSTKDILEKNQREIGDDAQSEMRKICRMLNIVKGMHIGITLYGYRSHLAVYTEILQMVKMESDGRRSGYLAGLTSNQLRDIKSKIVSEGKTGRKQEMLDGAVKKLKELRNYYVAYQQRLHAQQRREAERESNSNNYCQRMRRSDKEEEDEDSEDRVIIDVNQENVIKFVPPVCGSGDFDGDRQRDSNGNLSDENRENRKRSRSSALLEEEEDANSKCSRKRRRIEEVEEEEEDVFDVEMKDQVFEWHGSDNRNNKNSNQQSYDVAKNEDGFEFDGGKYAVTSMNELPEMY